MEHILKYFPELTEVQREQFSQLETLYPEWNARINVISPHPALPGVGQVCQVHTRHAGDGPRDGWGIPRHSIGRILP